MPVACSRSFDLHNSKRADRLRAKLSKFDRYVFSQLLTFCGFFALILVAIFWFDKALRMFERLLGKGQSTWLFLELTFLTLPPVIASILPIAGFAAAVFVINRLSADSELIVMKAAGRSTLRIIRSVLAFGILIALFMSLLTHFIIPSSSERLSSMRAQINQNMTSSFLTEGEFLHPTPGVTLYIGEVTPNAELKRVFLSDRRDKRNTVTFSSQKAYIVQNDDSVQLVMVDGLTQNIQEKDKKLLTARFDDFSMDISQLVSTGYSVRKSVTHVQTAELILQPNQVAAATNVTLGAIAFELHNRFAQPLLCIIAAVLGAATLLTGAYSRFGVWRQIVIAFFMLVGLKLIESAVSANVLDNNDRWFLMYAPSLAGAMLIWAITYFTDNPALITLLKKRLVKS